MEGRGDPLGSLGVVRMAAQSVFGEAVGTVSTIAGKLVNLPKAERSRYRAVLGDTFRLLDSAILLVDNRLRDIYFNPELQEPTKFANELQKLGLAEDWHAVEREVRLCHGLRAASSEMRTIPSGILSRLSIQDANAFWSLVSDVLEGESRLADHLTSRLKSLCDLADGARSSPVGREKARRALKRAIGRLESERGTLMNLEKETLAVL